jgi:hypothetical protein
MNSSSRQGHQKQHPVPRWQRIRLEMSEQVRLTAYHGASKTRQTGAG